MSTIRIRNVPDQLHRELKVRAGLNGMTLSSYLLDELRSLAARPTMREWIAKTESLEPVESDETPTEAIRAERERKTRAMTRRFDVT
jgi:antitoxin FitA